MGGPESDSSHRLKSIRAPFSYQLENSLGALVAQAVKRLPAMWETGVQSLGQEDPLEKEMATHYSCLEKSHGWRSLVGHSPWVTKSRTRLSDFTLDDIVWKQYPDRMTKNSPRLKKSKKSTNNSGAEASPFAWVMMSVLPKADFYWALIMHWHRNKGTLYIQEFI